MVSPTATTQLERNSTTTLPQRSSIATLPRRSSIATLPPRSVSVLEVRLRVIQQQLQEAMQAHNSAQIQELMAERSSVANEHQHLQAHQMAAASEEGAQNGQGTTDTVSRRVSAHIAGFGVRHGNSAGGVVAQHRNEILLNWYEKYILAFAVAAGVVCFAVLGLYVWQIVEYIRYANIPCRGSLNVFSKYVLGLSFLAFLVSTRILFVGDDGEEVASRSGCLAIIMRRKNGCVGFLLMVMVVYVLGLAYISFHHAMAYHAALDMEELPACTVAKPGLYFATICHTIGLIFYSAFLSVSFFGVGRILHLLMDRGILQTNGAPPEGAFAQNTCPVTELREGETTCSICLESMQADTAVMTRTCKHHFHSACLQNWMRVSGSCPLCRSYLGYFDASEAC